MCMWTFVERKQRPWQLQPVFIFTGDGKELRISQAMLNRRVAVVSEHDATGKQRFTQIKVSDRELNTREFYRALADFIPFTTTPSAELGRVVDELERLANVIDVAFSTERGLYVRFHPSVYTAPRFRSATEMEKLLQELCPPGYAGKFRQHRFGGVSFIYRERPQP